MRIADLYIRVSDKEAVNKDHSRKQQEKSLRRFCIIHSLRIGKFIYEDHSGKTFQRPQWAKLMYELRMYARQPDLLLFTTWDRFSLDAASAYRMSNMLRGLGTEPQAIEQPLDLSVAEDRIMLTFYLASVDIDNYVKAIHAFSGMTRAKKTDRLMRAGPSYSKYPSKEHKRRPVKGQKISAPTKCILNKHQARWMENDLMIWLCGYLLCSRCRSGIPGSYCQGSFFMP